MLILFKSRVKKQLKKVPKHIERKFRSLVEELKNNPIPARKFDIEKLKGYEHTYRVRLGNYRRALCTVHSKPSCNIWF